MTPEQKMALGAQAKAVLLNLRAAWPRGQAVVGGGFLRDLALGVRPKDMDLFIMADTREGPSEEMLKAMDESLGRIQWLARDGEYIAMGTCCRVGGTKVGPNGHPYDVEVNVIVLDNGIRPADDARLNDFGICQIWFDGENVDCTEAFKRDIERKTFTLSVCEDEGQFKRSMRRWDRLSKKFPEHALVIPFHYQVYQCDPSLECYSPYSPQ